MIDQPSRNIVQTADGSSTLYVPFWDEHYHSVHGAVQESNHVFIRAGFDRCSGQDKIRILEVGLGTGLNAWLTSIRALSSGQAVYYRGLEAFPLTMDEITALNYTEGKDRQDIELFENIYRADWNTDVQIYPGFILHKEKTFLQQWTTDDSYDLIYFDAFAPSAQDDLWTEEIFSKLYHAVNPGGSLVTYCAKGSVRRAMKAAGWQVEKLQGPPGKREMTRAFKG